jgi:hypothetical protein
MDEMSRLGSGPKLSSRTGNSGDNSSSLVMWLGTCARSRARTQEQSPKIVLLWREELLNCCCGAHLACVGRDREPDIRLFSSLIARKHAHFAIPRDLARISNPEVDDSRNPLPDLLLCFAFGRLGRSPVQVLVRPRLPCFSLKCHGACSVGLLSNAPLTALRCCRVRRILLMLMTVFVSAAR